MSGEYQVARTVKTKQWPAALCMAAYLLAVMLIFSVISVLCSPGIADASILPDGKVDLTELDLGDAVAVIPIGAALIYEGAFYTSEDFSAKKVTHEPEQITGNNLLPGDFGTVRFLLKLPAGKVYALSSKSAAYAQRLFINAEEYAPVGVTGDVPGSVIPKITRYTQAFLPQSDTTEIIIHYANFVHPDPGSLYAPKVGYVDTISRMEQLKTFQAAAITGVLLTAMLFFFGLFLYFASSRFLIWFSLACGCIALRGLITGDKALMLLMPDLGWNTVIRLEYLSACGLIIFTALYLHSLFPGAVKKWAMRGFAVFIAINAAFYCIVPPIVFTRFVWFGLAVSVAFLIYSLAAVFIAVIRKKIFTQISRVEQILLLAGISIYLVMSGMEIYAHENAQDLLGMDYAQVGIMMCLFISILALALGFSRTERALGAARLSERETAETNRMLARLDKLRTDFFANITHDMKTPLSVIRGYARLAIDDIDEGAVNQETRDGLAIISKEAQWLADLSDDLLHKTVEMDMENAREYRALSVYEMLEWAASTYRPIAQKNNNRLVIHIPDSLPAVRANGNIIHQVLINLIANANRHTRDGVISLKAAFADGQPHSGYVEISVSDNGNGIPSEFLPYVFERRVSGDGGTGLGLAACKENVESHGGAIFVHSAPGEGTSVRFTLPRAEEGWEI